MKAKKGVIEFLKQEREALEKKYESYSFFLLNNAANMPHKYVLLVEAEADIVKDYIDCLTERIDYLKSCIDKEQAENKPKNKSEKEAEDIKKENKEEEEKEKGLSENSIDDYFFKAFTSIDEAIASVKKMLNAMDETNEQKHR